MNSDGVGGSLWLPTKKEFVARPWFLPSEAQIEQRDAIMNSAFFLVRQGSTFGERLKCTRCNRRHNYITLMCIERPFVGLEGGLYAYYRTVEDNGLLQYMSKEERARYDTIGNTLGNMPDLSMYHPRTTKQIMKDTGTGASDMLLGALSLGILEGIARVHAERLIRRINDRGLRPKLVLVHTPSHEREEHGTNVHGEFGSFLLQRQGLRQTG